MAANDWQRAGTGLLMPRGISSVLVPSEDSAGKIENFALTQEGTLRSCPPPCEYHPTSYGVGGPDSTDYTKPHRGLFHAIVEGRDILLGHFNNGIYVHEGWVPQWRLLLGPSGSGAEQETAFPQDTNIARWNTQFTFTGSYIVITIQGGRSWAYNGDMLLPLGYKSAPSPPVGLGPLSAPRNLTVSMAYQEAANTSGYAYDGRRMPQVFGPNRIGSINTASPGYATGSGGTNAVNKNGGTLETGAWNYATQFIDAFGNLSPVSGPSNLVTCARWDNWDPDNNAGGAQGQSASRLRLQLAAQGVPRGPDGTVGRILLRTKDQAGSGIPGLFEIPNTVGSGALSYATLPDNSSTFFPDNVPDTAIVKRATEVDPVPNFRLSCMAYGRLWVGNWPGQRTAVRPSLVGQFGTFPSGMVYTIDPDGTELTGMHMTRAGLLCFTDSSTAVVVPTDGSGDQFIRKTLSTTQGCVAPDSIETLPNGETVWLGREGFYAFDGESIRMLSLDIKEEVISRVNYAAASRSVAAVAKEMGEYRCWVPSDGSVYNNLGVVYSPGLGFRTLTYAEVEAVCTTRDPRQYMLALGRCNTGGNGTQTPSVWVLDHSTGSDLVVDQPTAIFETAWLTASNSERRSTAYSVSLLVRCTGDFTPTVTVCRDWRRYPEFEATAFALVDDADEPPMWDDTTDDGATWNGKARRDWDKVYDDLRWPRRRPRWGRIDIQVPSCETYKLRIVFQGDIEIVGFKGYHVDSHKGGAAIARGEG